MNDNQYNSVNDAVTPKQSSTEDSTERKKQTADHKAQMTSLDLRLAAVESSLSKTTREIGRINDRLSTLEQLIYQMRRGIRV